MGYQITGKLFISGIDFWGFVHKVGEDIINGEDVMFGTPQLNRGEFCIEIPVVSGADWKELKIDLIEFWTFVTKYLPRPEDCVVYGIPEWVDFNTGESQIEIDFAADSEGDPMNWATLPEAAKQWRDAR